MNECLFWVSGEKFFFCNERVLSAFSGENFGLIAPFYKKGHFRSEGGRIPGGQLPMTCVPHPCTQVFPKAPSSWRTVPSPTPSSGLVLWITPSSGPAFYTARGVHHSRREPCWFLCAIGNFRKWSENVLSPLGLPAIADHKTPFSVLRPRG
jgi:hypothetical protein